MKEEDTISAHKADDRSLKETKMDKSVIQTVSSNIAGVLNINEIAQEEQTQCTEFLKCTR